jgi:hypothetical protein
MKNFHFHTPNFTAGFTLYEINTKFWLENLRGRDQSEDLGVLGG